MSQPPASAGVSTAGSRRRYRPSISLLRLALVAIVLIGAMWALARWPGYAIAGLTVAKDFVAREGGYFWIAVVTLLLIVSIFCLVIGHGKDRLARRGPAQYRQTPQLNTPAWFLAIFIAGTATGLVVWAAAEPLRHLAGNPLIQKDDFLAGRSNARALGLTMFHWGFHVWAVFSLTGLAIAQAGYKHGLPLRLSSALYPILGREVQRTPGVLIDVLAMVSALFVLLPVMAFSLIEVEALLRPFTGHNDTAGVLSVAKSSLERAARLAADGDLKQFEAFIARRMPIPPNVIYFHAAFAAIATLALALGLRQGVKWLVFAASIALLLAVALLLVAGPTRAAALNMMTGALSYFGEVMPEMLNPFRDEQMKRWQAWWTVWSWGGWIALAPVVGAFLARISRGRTVRQYMLGTFVVPSVISLLLIGLLGGGAVQLECCGPGGLTGAARSAPQLVLPEAIKAMDPSFLGFRIDGIQRVGPFISLLLPALVLLAAFACWSSALGGYLINQRDGGPAAVLNAATPVLLGGAVSGLWLSGSLSALNAARSAGFLLSIFIGLLLLVTAYCAVKLLRRARRRLTRLDRGARIG